jgi:hypothetical protein
MRKPTQSEYEINEEVKRITKRDPPVFQLLHSVQVPQRPIGTGGYGITQQPTPAPDPSPNKGPRTMPRASTGGPPMAGPAAQSIPPSARKQSHSRSRASKKQNQFPPTPNLINGPNSQGPRKMKRYEVRKATAISANQFLPETARVQLDYQDLTIRG